MVPKDNQSAMPEFFLHGFQLQYSNRIFVFLFLLVVYMMTVTGNLLIITLVSATHYLKSPMYYFLSHLSFCDLILTTSIVPKLLHVTIHKGSRMTVSGCITQLHFFSFSSTTECLLLTIMSYDRYVAVCKPLYYVTIMGVTFCRGLVVVSWFLGWIITLTVTVLISYLLFCKSENIDHFFCDYSPFLKVSCSDATVVRTVIFMISAPETIIETVFIITTYVYIFIAIHRISSSTGKQKAFSTCSSHLAVVCTYYGTLIAIYVAPFGEGSTNGNKILSLIYTVVTPLLNPIIYSLRNNEIKATIKKMVENNRHRWVPSICHYMYLLNTIKIMVEGKK